MCIRDSDKTDTIKIPIGDTRLKVEVEPVTENISSTASTDAYWGGILYANVKNPKDALSDFEKYDFAPFDKKYIDERVFDYLNRAKKYVQNSGAADDILSAFMGFYEKRQALLPYRERLQDIPMLQVINKYSDFAEYLSDVYKRQLDN